MDDLSYLYFVEPIIVILTKVTDGKPAPISRHLKNMQDLMDLRKEIRDGKLLPQIGDFTLDQQLWFAVAKYAKLIREKGEAPPGVAIPPPQVLDILDQLQ